jgi:NAD(P)-dependent dehydrogenase (short-subunit alcohol dehydrogenase family)
MTDRTALVAGGARGVGRAITERLVADGAVVAVATRDQPDDLPAGARWFPADVRDPASVDALVDAVVAAHGRLDVLVTNAGGSPVAEAATAAPAWTESILTLNLLAPWHLAVTANRVMQGQETGGTIVHLGSLAAHRPAPGTAAFGAAKAGLAHLTRSTAVEWAPKVRVNCVSLPVERDGGADAAVPVGRRATDDDVAAAVVHLASPGSAYVTGADLVLHGGGERPAYLAALAGS